MLARRCYREHGRGIHQYGSLMLFRSGVMLSLPVTALVAGGFCWTNQCSKPNRLVRQYGLPPVKLLKGTWMLHVEHFFLAPSTDCLEELERHTLHTKLSGSRSKDRCILCCFLAIIWPLQRRVICSLLAGGFRFDRHRLSLWGKNLRVCRHRNDQIYLHKWSVTSTRCRQKGLTNHWMTLCGFHVRYVKGSTRVPR